MIRLNFRYKPPIYMIFIIMLFPFLILFMGKKFLKGLIEKKLKGVSFNLVLFFFQSFANYL